MCTNKTTLKIELSNRGHLAIIALGLIFLSPLLLEPEVRLSLMQLPEAPFIVQVFLYFIIFVLVYAVGLYAGVVLVVLFIGGALVRFVYKIYKKRKKSKNERI